MQNKVIQIPNNSSKNLKMNSQKNIRHINKQKPIYNQKSKDLHIENNLDNKPDNGKIIYFYNILYL